MSEQIKYIIGELNKPPFNKSFNLISFDSISPEERLQILTDVLGEINEKNKAEVRTEEPEQTTIRLLSNLRVFKYDPGSDVMGFRQGLVEGDKKVINPILEWLLKNMKDLKKRAYLAEFLVKIEIPFEIGADTDIASLYEQYENLIEEFKLVHKEYESVKAQCKSTAELRADIETMEMEKEIVVKRTERLMRKLENIENKEALLDGIHQLRVERDRQKELSQQRQEELNLMEELQQKNARLSQQLKEVRASNQGTTPQMLLKQLEEECRVNEYFVKERLPQELEKRKREIEVMSRIALEPPPSNDDLAQLQAKVDRMSDEVNEMMQKNIIESNVEDRSAIIRQQAAIVGRRKEELGEEYNRAKNELDKLNRMIEERDGEGKGVVSEEEFKDYVSRLKVRSTLYKAKKSQIAGLVAESGVLARTLDILNQQLTSVSHLQGTGEWSGDLMNLNLDEMSKDELLRHIADVNTKTAAQKVKLTPIIEELRETREKYNEVLEDYTEKKKIYDAAAAKADSTIAKLKQEVNQMRKDYQKADSEVALLTAKTDIAEVLLLRAQDEFTRFSEKGSTNSLRERLTAKIAEQEKVNKNLKEEQKKVKESQEKLAKQRDLWQGLNQLLECKLSCINKQREKDGVVKREEGAETLVIQ